MTSKQRKELERLYALDQAEREEQRRTDERTYVGQFFRYDNSYSCPQGPKDRWWLYAAPYWSATDKSVRLFKFQTDKDGKMEVEPEGYFSASTCQDEISEATFNAAWDTFKRKINAAPGVTKPTGAKGDA